MLQLGFFPFIEWVIDFFFFFFLISQKQNKTNKYKITTSVRTVFLLIAATLFFFNFLISHTFERSMANGTRGTAVAGGVWVGIRKTCIFGRI